MRRLEFCSDFFNDLFFAAKSQAFIIPLLYLNSIPIDLVDFSIHDSGHAISLDQTTTHVFQDIFNFSIVAERPCIKNNSTLSEKFFDFFNDSYVSRPFLSFELLSRQTTTSRNARYPSSRNANADTTPKMETEPARNK